MYLGQVETPAPGTTPDQPSWVTAIADLAKQGLSLWQQARLQDFNMDLIRQGKPPLTASQMAAMAPQLNVGLAPSTQTAMLWVLGGVGLVFLVTAMMKSR